MIATPVLRKVLVEEGAVLGSFQGSEQVLHYGDWLAEYAALTQAAGVVDRAANTLLELTGEDRASFVNRLCTNKINHLAPGSGCETFLADAKGHVVAYLWLLVRPDSLLLYTAAGQGPRILTHLDRYLIREKVELHDRTDQVAAMQLSGPMASRVLGSLGSPLPPDQPLAGIPAEVAGCPIWLCAVEPAEPQTCLVLVDAEHGAAVWKALRQAGAAACGQWAHEALRIELGWPVYGRDITEENFPQEVARDGQTLSFNKGCYLGQETIARIDSRGHVNKTLVGLKFPGDAVPQPGTELSAENRPVGQITSATFSPQLKTALALGYVRRTHNAPGTRLDSPQGPVEVVRLPVFARPGS